MIVSIHWTIGGLSISLTLKSWRWTCCLKFWSHWCTEGLALSKFFAFIRFHSFQDAIMKISMKKGNKCVCLAMSNLSQTSGRFGHWIPNLFQQVEAKGQVKNSWSKSSWVAKLHMTQKTLGCTWKFLLTSILVVLSLSTSKSQVKNLTRGMDLDFHISLKTGEVCKF